MKSKILSGLMLIASSNLLAASQYKIEVLGTLGGDESYATDINENGDIVGTSTTSEGINHAFVSSLIDEGRTITDLSASQENTESTANAINNNGQVVGTFKILTDPDGSDYQAFISEKTDATWLTTDLIAGDHDESTAIDINDAGQITGRWDRLVYIAYKDNDEWTASQLFETTHFEGATSDPHSTSEGTVINSSGQIVIRHADIYNTSSFIASYENNSWQQPTTIQGLGGRSATEGGAITRFEDTNNSNQMIGYSKALHPVLGGGRQNYIHAVIARKTEGEWTLTDIGQTNDNTETFGLDINDSEIAIGYSSTYIGDEGVQKNAFIYVDEKMYPLIDLVASASDNQWTSLTKATGINNAGQIVGEGIYNGKKRAFLLTPTESIANCAIGLDPKVIKVGEGTALWWWTENALTAKIDGNIGEVETPSNYKWISPEKSTTFIMEAKGNDGESTLCKAEVIVEGICEMGTDPQTITTGEGSALWWWTKGIDNVLTVFSEPVNNSGRSWESVYNLELPSGSQWLTPDEISPDGRWVSPTETTTYKMTAVTADGGQTHCETTIVVE
jgi:probable HAF family extracellular repeat protein